MKKFLKGLWKGIKIIPQIIWSLFLDWVVGLISLVIGTLAIFAIGFSVWLLTGYKGVDTYFKALTNQK